MTPTEALKALAVMRVWFKHRNNHHGVALIEDVCNLIRATMREDTVGEKVEPLDDATIVLLRKGASESRKSVNEDTRSLGLGLLRMIARIDHERSRAEKAEARTDSDLRQALQFEYDGRIAAEADAKRLREAVELARQIVVRVASEGWPDPDLHLHGTKVPARALPSKLVADICRLEGVFDGALTPPAGKEAGDDE